MTDTTALASPVNYGPVQLDRQKLALIGNTIAPDLTPNELALFGEVCMRKQLDPFSGQIHAIKRYVNQKTERGWEKVGRVTFQTSQEGFLSLAERTNEYDGMDAPVFGPLCGCGEVTAKGDYDEETRERGEAKQVAHPESATVTVFRKGFSRPISATAYWHEYYPGAKQGGMWHKMPRIMLAKVARVAALRLAFPYVMGGLLSDDEMQQADRDGASAPALVAPEATKDSPPTGAAIQPAPPAPVADPIPPASVAPVEPTQEPAAPPPPGPNAMPVAPLAGANVSRRLGVGRSISPVRRNVVSVQPTQAAETPATAPEAVPAATAPPESVLDQPAPSALTDEPDLPAAEDPGKREYLNQQRQLLRESTATLFRVNAIIENVKLGMDGKEPKPLPVPSANEGSDKALADRINADWPGRTLANLGEAELASLMERFESSLVKKRDWMKERGISEE